MYAILCLASLRIVNNQMQCFCVKSYFITMMTFSTCFFFLLFTKEGHLNVFGEYIYFTAILCLAESTIIKFRYFGRYFLTGNPFEAG